jgi:serine/threonine protein kinase/tetratricopeptide (TPR) repeat protein
MTQRAALVPPESDSTDGLLADWNIEPNEPADDPAPAAGEPDRPLEPKTAATPAETTVHPPPRPRDPLAGESLRFLQEFRLPDPADPDSAAHRRSARDPDGDTVRRPDRLHGSAGTRPRRLGIEARETGPAVLGSRSSRELPDAGDVLSGFRILQELGRGAFARVYLAEEIHLGGRPVAIKVSPAEGDEPRILARLQHANIVPVHSVCDDRASGLRVLCMPYFGGANLAQVLETTGGLSATGRGGHSLVEALDQISRHQQSSAGTHPRPPSADRAPARSSGIVAEPRSVPEEAPRAGPASRSEASGGRPPTVRRAAGGRKASGLTPAARHSGQSPSRTASLSASTGSALAIGFRSLLSRIIGGGTFPPATVRPPSSGDDPHQPARQFLRGATATRAAVWIVARLAEGLDHAHSRGLLHRDLKPANILIAADGTPMLLDFNLAAETQPPSAEGQIGRAMLGGTIPYMAPEHLDAFDPRGTTPANAVDERADIYALGLILFEVLAGGHPFPMPGPAPGTAPSDIIGPMIEARRRPPSLRARCPQVPPSLDALVSKCLAFDPSRRYQRARDLAEDLRRFLDDLPMKHAPEPSLRERAGKFARRHQALCSSTSIALISTVFIVALGMGVAVVHSGMQGLVARFHRQAFERDFNEAQFLLNTADAADRHLTAGLIVARRILDRLDLSEDRQNPAAEWFQGLTEAERGRLRAQVVELLMLEARARVRLASRSGTEADRMEAIRRAVARLDMAGQLADHLPAALYRERARYQSQLGHASLAERDQKLAALTRPATSHDWTLLGTAMLAAGDPSAAEDALRQALRLECTSFWAWFMIGHCHFAQARYTEAAGDFSACTALGPQFAWAHFNRGLALARSGLLDPARDAYDQALRLDPEFTEAMVNRALVELELNRVESALADLSMAIRLGRHDAAILAARGEALARLGRTTEAERQFAAILSADPDNALARVARAMTRLGTDPKGARADLERVLARDPRHAAAHYGMALLIRPHDPTAALKHLDIAIDADPHLIDAIQLRALVRARLGEPSALDDVDRLLKIPTARRCYNAACAVAVYAVKAHQPRQLAHALELLTRAVDLGFPAAEAVDDPDLAPLRGLPDFERLLRKHRR